jgi:hypothetical protein
MLSAAQLSNPALECVAITAAGDAVLAQCESLVLAVSEHAYTAESQTHRGGTLGKHLRHTLDHFAAALAVLADPAATISYDRRARNVPMETSRAAAIAAIAHAREQLAAAAPEALHTPVRVRIMINAQGQEADLMSTLGRELAFATHHAVHHQAMMKAIAAEFGVDLDERFGKAPSTLEAQLKAQQT